MRDWVGFVLSTALSSLTCALIYKTCGRPPGALKRALLPLLSLLLCWQVADTLFSLITPPADRSFFFTLRLPLRAFFSLALLFFTLSLYGARLCGGGVTTLILGVVPLITLVLALVSPLHGFLYTALSFPPDGAEFVLSLTTPGVWFWVCAAFSCVLETAALAVTWSRGKLLPSLYRAQAASLPAGLLLSLVGFLLDLTGMAPAADMSLAGASLCALFCFLATRDNPGLAYVNRTRGEVFNSLDKGILILDGRRSITSSNLAAKYMLFKLGLSPHAPYPAILAIAARKARSVEAGGSAQDSTVYRFGPPEDERVYHLQEKPILDRRGQEIGRMAICTDSTEMHATIRHLENSVGLDAMTGLMNRSSMRRRQKEIDTPGSLPIAAIAGDLNSLKITNDTLGHQQGDTLIRVAAEGLVYCCPPSAYIARMGGDEFLILIPRCSRERANRLMESIRSHLRKANGPMGGVSMALGAAVKTAKAQRLDAVIVEADRRMYARKNAERSGRGPVAKPARS